VGGRIIFKRVFKFEWEEVKWIGLAQDGYNLCQLLNPVTNISFPQNVLGGGIFVLYEKVNILRAQL
jgi:hypothetical protein